MTPQIVYQFGHLLVTGFQMTGRRNGPGLRIALPKQAAELDVEEARLLHQQLGAWLHSRSPGDGTGTR